MILLLYENICTGKKLILHATNDFCQLLSIQRSCVLIGVSTWKSSFIVRNKLFFSCVPTKLAKESIWCWLLSWTNTRHSCFTIHTNLQQTKLTHLSNHLSVLQLNGKKKQHMRSSKKVHRQSKSQRENPGQGFISCYFCHATSCTYTCCSMPRGPLDPQGLLEAPVCMQISFSHWTEHFLPRLTFACCLRFNRWLGTWLDGGLTGRLNIQGGLMPAGSMYENWWE